MSDECKGRVLRKDCPSTETQETKKECQPFEFCAGNKSVSFDGDCITVTPRTYLIPDGTYSTVTFKDGCIVGVGQVPVASYTPSSCCGDLGDNVNLDGNEADDIVTITLSDDPTNLLEQTAAGYSVTPIIRGNGVTVTGSGTSSDPFIISTVNDEVGGASLVSLSPTALEVGYDDYSELATIKLKSVITAGRYGDFKVNEYGQITEYAEPDKEAITDIQSASSGVFEVNRTGNLVTLGLSDTKLKELFDQIAEERLPTLVSQVLKSMGK